MIHYFKEGNLNYDYTDSWIKYSGGIEIKRWDSEMLPYDRYPELIRWRDKKNWTVLSNFLRLWAINEFGGIYLDCDVELIKPIEKLFDYNSFVCIESPPTFANNAVCGGKPGCFDEAIKMYLDIIEGRKSHWINIEVSSGPWVITDYVCKIKGAPMDDSDIVEFKDYGAIVTLPKRVFYPFNWNETYYDSCITDDTYGIHWRKKSWG